MVVIAHQTIHVATPPLLLDFSAEEPQKLSAIGLIEKDGLLGVAARGEVIERTRKLEAKGAGHAIGR